jgi:archaellum component FlaC
MSSYSSDNNGSWQEYKNLVIKELERNDENVQKVLEGVQEIGNEIACIKTSLVSIKEDINNSISNTHELEEKINTLEKDYVALKAKVMMAASIASIIISAVATFVSRYIFIH